MSPLTIKERLKELLRQLDETTPRTRDIERRQRKEHPEVVEKQIEEIATTGTTQLPVG